MLKQEIKFTDLDGNEQVETVYFNMTKSELSKMELREATIKGEEVTGGFRERILKVTEGGNGGEIIDMIETVIRESVGTRSEDGKKFYKTEQAAADFMASMAYDELFMQLVTDADKASQFMNAIVPKDISDSMTVEAQKAKTAYNASQKKESGGQTVTVTNDQQYTAEERAMIEKLRGNLQ